MSNEDDKVQLASILHSYASKANEMEARLNYLIANHEGYVAVAIDELSEMRNIIVILRDAAVMEAELLAKVEDGLDKMLISLGIDPSTMEDR